MTTTTGEKNKSSSYSMGHIKIETIVHLTSVLKRGVVMVLVWGGGQVYKIISGPFCLKSLGVGSPTLTLV